MQTYEDWKKSNWDRAHKEQDVSALTGTGIGGHLHTLKVPDLVKPDSSILCIGVGTGVWLNEMAERVAEVWGLDVTPKASMNLPKSIKFTCNPKDLPKNHFDLALSLWVAPHISNHDLQEQLNSVVPSLKNDGVFAMHYKEPIDPNLPLDNREGANDEYKKAFTATMLRRRGHLSQMVEWAGGTVSKTFGDNISHFYNIVEAIAHIQKSKTGGKLL